MKKAGCLATLVVSGVFVCALFTRHNGGKIASNDNQACRSCQMKSLGGWMPRRSLSNDTLSNAKPTYGDTHPSSARILTLKKREHPTFMPVRNDNEKGGITSLSQANVNSTSHSQYTDSIASKSDNHSSSFSTDTKEAKSSPISHQGTVTLSRLGSALGFDVDACPSGSLMLGNWQNRTPHHNNCPTLFIVGARKGGTTSLYHYMDKHPNFEGIRLNNQPMDGETFYFTHHSVRRWSRYVSQFPENCMSGESSVDNMVSCEVPRRIFRACGLQAKVVMLLRNPIERFVSNFLMRARLGTYAWHPTSMNTNISSEVMSELQIAVKILANTTQNYSCSTLSPKDWRKYRCRFAPAVNMVYEGMYYIFVMNYLCNFPAENILIVNSEEFFCNPSRILSQIFYFLGLERLDGKQLDNITSVVFNERKNVVLPHQVLSVADKKQLNCAYRPFNAALFKLLQWDDGVWN